MINFVHQQEHIMNDYYKVDFVLSPADNDACDLIAASLADEGYESFEPADDGSAMTAYVPAAQYTPEWKMLWLNVSYPSMCAGAPLLWKGATGTANGSAIISSLL